MYCGNKKGRNLCNVKFDRITGIFVVRKLVHKKIIQWIKFLVQSVKREYQVFARQLLFLFKGVYNLNLHGYLSYISV